MIQTELAPESVVIDRAETRGIPQGLSAPLLEVYKIAEAFLRHPRMSPEPHRDEPLMVSVRNQLAWWLGERLLQRLKVPLTQRFSSMYFGKTVELVSLASVLGSGAITIPILEAQNLKGELADSGLQVRVPILTEDQIEAGFFMLAKLGDLAKDGVRHPLTVTGLAYAFGLTVISSVLDSDSEHPKMVLNIIKKSEGSGDSHVREMIGRISNYQDGDVLKIGETETAFVITVDYDRWMDGVIYHRPDPLDEFQPPGSSICFAFDIDGATSILQIGCVEQVPFDTVSGFLDTLFAMGCMLEMDVTRIWQGKEGMEAILRALLETMVWIDEHDIGNACNAQQQAVDQFNLLDTAQDGYEKLKDYYMSVIRDAADFTKDIAKHMAQIAAKIPTFSTVKAMEVINAVVCVQAKRYARLVALREADYGKVHVHNLNLLTPDVRMVETRSASGMMIANAANNAVRVCKTTDFLGKEEGNELNVYVVTIEREIAGRRYVSLTVVDNMEGMDDGVIKSILAGDPSVKSTTGGRGLGLALIRSIAHFHASGAPEEQRFVLQNGIPGYVLEALGESETVDAGMIKAIQECKGACVSVLFPQGSPENP